MSCLSRDSSSPTLTATSRALKATSPAPTATSSPARQYDSSWQPPRTKSHVEVMETTQNPTADISLWRKRYTNLTNTARIDCCHLPGSKKPHPFLYSSCLGCCYPFKMGSHRGSGEQMDYKWIWYQN